MTRSTRILRAAIHSYQIARAHRLSPCRFVPSCSEYALEAVSVHGAGRGSWLAFRRILRCQPFGGRGFDPVPSGCATVKQSNELSRECQFDAAPSSAIASLK